MSYNHEPMLEMYLFETNQLIEQLEEILLESEKCNIIGKDHVNEIFRIMHTVKGSSAMMMFNNIAGLSHVAEDMFSFLRETDKEDIDYGKICDLSLQTLDFIRAEVQKIESGVSADGQEKALKEEIAAFLLELKGTAPEQAKKKEETEPASAEKPKQKFYISKYESQPKLLRKYRVSVFFQAGSQMENVRAFTVVHNLKDFCQELYHEPAELFEDENASTMIMNEGFHIFLSTELEEDELRKKIDEAFFIENIELEEIEDFGFQPAAQEEAVVMPVVDFRTDRRDTVDTPDIVEEGASSSAEETAVKSLRQNLISVNVNKIDMLMDLVGEIVITEAMVTKNPDLAGLDLENFSKSARQLRKLTDELQDVVMSIRMLPIGPTFQKMNRIVRDMSKKFSKEAVLSLSGEETEVDKNIIDNLGDPLMHLIRNAMDHGLESPEERETAGKPRVGKIHLEAYNTGGDVIIRINDDGRGLNRKKILEKAKANKLITKPETEMTDHEVYNLIMLPGFSTKEQVTEFSGRGVGMDVVRKNIEKVGGIISIESTEGKGSSMIIRIPLTLAIIDGMQISVGKSIYTIPTISIRESFRPTPDSLIHDTEDNEMIMIRGNVYPIIRACDAFGVNSRAKLLEEGILVMVEDGEKTACIFADALLGEQQVVVKPLPKYLYQYQHKSSGIGGCTILGDGNISLIINSNELLNKYI